MGRPKGKLTKKEALPTRDFEAERRDLEAAENEAKVRTARVKARIRENQAWWQTGAQPPSTVPPSYYDRMVKSTSGRRGKPLVKQ